ncbi:lasso peptide [Calothrix sp. 336/3]|uniref:lasso peptide n=1 Tax=Calothrix sp. 336/3 TaxID=1337936 RepID=UPI0004E3CFF2|nr:hypothetical protein IJ00_06185 [Calothrix sp. 336/3]
MKKVYSQPLMTNHGSVEEMTKFFDPSPSSTDFIFFPGDNAADGQLSGRSGDANGTCTNGGNIGQCNYSRRASAL